MGSFYGVGTGDTAVVANHQLLVIVLVVVGALLVGWGIWKCFRRGKPARRPDAVRPAAPPEEPPPKSPPLSDYLRK